MWLASHTPPDSVNFYRNMWLDIETCLLILIRIFSRLFHWYVSLRISLEFLEGNYSIFQVKLLFSNPKTIAPLVNYTWKLFIKLTPREYPEWWHCFSDNKFRHARIRSQTHMATLGEKFLELGAWLVYCSK